MVNFSIVEKSVLLLPLFITLFLVWQKTQVMSSIFVAQFLTQISYHNANYLP